MPLLPQQACKLGMPVSVQCADKLIEPNESWRDCMSSLEVKNALFPAWG